MRRASKSAFGVTNKVILVLGGEGLIGRCLCRGLYDYGARVISGDINLRGYRWKQKIPTCHVDTCSESSLQEAMDGIETEYGQLDVMINATYPRGKGYGKGFWDVDYSEFTTNLSLHVGGYFCAARATANRMAHKQIKGSIILFGSIYGLVSPEFSLYEGTSMTAPAEYACAKGGIVQFTRYLAALLGPYGIRVNCISPGGILDKQPQCFVSKYRRRTPLGRMGVPEDLLGPVLFLASDASRYITGHNLLVDGGWTIA